MPGLRRAAAAQAALLAVSACVHAQQLEPFRTLNLSPTVAVYGLPQWETPAEGTRVAVMGDIANDYRFSSGGDDLLALDGETWRAGVEIEHGFGRKWTAGIEIPYERQTGGVLDDAIDAWHSAFDLPDGGRNQRPQDQLLFLLANGPRGLLSLRHGAGGLGDVSVGLGRRFSRASGDYYLHAAIKLPTGDPSILTGSGATDFALTLLRSRPLPLEWRPAGLFWGVGAVHLGEAERIPFVERRNVFAGTLGAAIRILPRTGFEVQVEVHSPLYDSVLTELGHAAVQASLGGWRELERGRRLEFAINEDLNVGTAPDVAVHVAYVWNL